MAKDRSAPDVDESEVAFIDLMACIALMFACLLLLVIWFIADPKDEGAPPPGQLVVEIVWPPGMNVDVDLWVDGPAEERPVGYSHRKGRIWNLLRDDLGTVRDELEVNMEHAYSRGVPDGLYTVNVHLYNNRTTPPPIPVMVEVGLQENKRVATLMQKKVELLHKGQELTVFSWEMRAGSFLPQSVEDIQRSLRTRR